MVISIFMEKKDQHKIHKNVNSDYFLELRNYGILALHFFLSFRVILKCAFVSFITINKTRVYFIIKTFNQKYNCLKILIFSFYFFSAFYCELQNPLKCET